MTVFTAKMLMEVVLFDSSISFNIISPETFINIPSQKNMSIVDPTYWKLHTLQDRR